MNFLKRLSVLPALLLLATFAHAQQFTPVTPTSTVPPNVGGVIYTTIIAANPTPGAVCGTYNVAYYNYLTGDMWYCVNGGLQAFPSRLRTGTSSNTDLAGFITLSGGAGSYTFANTSYAVAPVCTATDTTAANATKASATATVLTVGGTSTDVLAYTCVVRN